MEVRAGPVLTRVLQRKLTELLDLLGMAKVTELELLVLIHKHVLWS